MLLAHEHLVVHENTVTLLAATRNFFFFFLIGSNKKNLTATSTAEVKDMVHISDDGSFYNYSSQLNLIHKDNYNQK